MNKMTEPEDSLYRKKRNEKCVHVCVLIWKREKQRERERGVGDSVVPILFADCATLWRHMIYISGAAVWRIIQFVASVCLPSNFSTFKPSAMQ